MSAPASNPSIFTALRAPRQYRVWCTLRNGWLSPGGTVAGNLQDAYWWSHRELAQLWAAARWAGHASLASTDLQVYPVRATDLRGTP